MRHAFLRPAVLRHGTVGLAALIAALPAQTEAGFLRPPSPIAEVVEAEAWPDASLSPQGQWLCLQTRSGLPGLSTLARPHHKLAGLRVDPVRFGRQAGAATVTLTLKRMADSEERRVDVPLPGDWSAPIWSADDRAFALLRYLDGGAELWLADPADKPPRRLEGVRVNTVATSGVRWWPDQQRLLVNLVVPGLPPEQPAVPAGPQVQETVPNQKAQVRTYQDLLQDAHDEALFAFYASSQLALVDARANVQRLGDPGLWERADPSPDGALLLTERVERPFSYAVPASQFARCIEIRDREGKVVRELHRRGVQDAIPIGGVVVGPRSIAWVPTAPHLLVWFEAKDGGDPNVTAEHRDQVMLLAEPTRDPRPWFRTEHRATDLGFGAENGLVLATETDRKTRRQRVHRFDLGDLTKPGTRLWERSTQDVYGDPGSPISERLPNGRSVVRMRDGFVFLAGQGASPAGNRPFVDAFRPGEASKDRLFHAEAGAHESFLGFLDDAGLAFLIRSETPTSPPSLFVVDRRTGVRRLLLAFADKTAAHTKGIQKRLLKYERADGVAMSGTLYLPPNYREGQRLPCLVWAYPLEYSQASDAGQVRASANRYVRLGGSSHLLLLLAGYAVFDDAAMPIVGPQRTANDTFVLQLQQNADAAKLALQQSGCVDVSRLAVAGHSYGAFMTANLLAHTDIFVCGIARSGAYNRTLTPFGFQNEERTYWEAPEVYQTMSPFAQAHRISEPLLLIHGADDDNPGTFPVQSQRLFAALKGHGGTARLCMLPHESHGYRARETVLHCLAEMVAWLDRHCRDAAR
jgi:dipeptidyl aminopeptidase/acylaminoacyl peptidase